MEAILEQIEQGTDWVNDHPGMPEVNISHLEALTDNTGIFQHALYHMPNLKEGYCIDDNARALLLTVLAGNACEGRYQALLPVYLRFIHYMQTSEGHFRNFMLYDRTCPERVGSEDSFGRTLMALGYLVNHGLHETYRQAAREMLEASFEQAKKLRSLRGIANAIVGLNEYLQHNKPDDLKKIQIALMADEMISQYRYNREKDWRWFEPVLAYDNAILPLALLHAYEATSKEEYLEVALESMRFLESVVLEPGYLRPVGNMGWYPKGGECAKFDQQGIDAMAMVLYYQKAWALFQREEDRDKAAICFDWFIGRNDLGISLYDEVTGGCSDGLHAHSINRNKGAESTLSFWISHFLVSSMNNA